MVRSTCEHYAQQDYVKAMALNLFTEETRANATLVAVKEPSKLTTSEVESLLLETAEIDVGLQTLRTWMKALDHLYAGALTEPCTDVRHHRSRTAHRCQSGGVYVFVSRRTRGIHGVSCALRN
jgi:hypothetical protein